MGRRVEAANEKCITVPSIFRVAAMAFGTAGVPRTAGRRHGGAESDNYQPVANTRAHPVPAPRWIGVVQTSSSGGTMDHQSQLNPPSALPCPDLGGQRPPAHHGRGLRRRALESVVVLDHGRVRGVLTQKDLLRAAAGGHQIDVDVADVCCRQVDELMTSKPLIVGTRTTVADAAQSMLRAGVGSAVTVDDEAVMGVVTAGVSRRRPARLATAKRRGWATCAWK